MKKFLAPLLSMLLITLFAGCFVPNNPVASEPATSGTLDSADVPAEWEEMNAAFAREGSSQYENATLMMKYLSNGCALFEFRLMEGSEADDSAFDTIVSGVLMIEENGTGAYETIPDGENPFSVHFTLSENGQAVEVTHDGTLEISPDGRYAFVENQIEVSDTSVSEILGFLPTAATSLNSSVGAYTIHYPDALLSDWFYSVEAVFDDSGAVLAKFLIAKDLSAVFRVDDDIEPIMIFGSAQPMMDAYVMEAASLSSAEGAANDADGGEPGDSGYQPRQLVSVILDHGAYMTPGASGKLMAVFPADLPYTLTAESLDKAVAVVDENGVVTAVGEGITEIQCVVICEDGEVKISVPICVTKALESDTVIPQ